MAEPARRAKVVYLVGDYRDHRFTPERVAVLDEGGCYYAPQSLRDARGRQLIWGWLQEGRGAEAQQAAGWSGLMCLPAELSLTPDGRLAMSPVPELQGLRREHRRELGVTLRATAPFTPPGVHGSPLELIATLEAGDARCIGLSVLRSPDGAEETRIVFDCDARRLTVDRSRSSLGAATQRDTREVPVRPAADGTLTLRVFVDGCVVEIFASDGTCVATRMYPTRTDSTDVCFFAEGGDGVLRSLDVWTMSSIWQDE